MYNFKRKVVSGSTEARILFTTYSDEQNSLTRDTSVAGIYLQVAQLSHGDRAAGWVIYGQKWKTGTERQYFTDIIGLSSTNDVIGQQSNRIWRKIPNKGYYAAQGHSRSSRSVPIESRYATSYY